MDRRCEQGCQWRRIRAPPWKTYLHGHAIGCANDRCITDWLTVDFTDVQRMPSGDATPLSGDDAAILSPPTKNRFSHVGRKSPPEVAGAREVREEYLGHAPANEVCLICEETKGHLTMGTDGNMYCARCVSTNLEKETKAKKKKKIPKK